VSVKERTRQIGIQKALGATPGFILSQFLLESVALSLAGCVLGLLLVAMGVKVASGFLGFPMTLSVANMSLGVLISSLTGLVAGIWPARTAARLQPAEAMRSR
ncbi:MAG: FtsX-like permease family protein, partial [Flavobacteriales bacterium]|nr:FtsX-like permease family protein [Flavobacteriales bacterium]